MSYKIKYPPCDYTNGKVYKIISSNCDLPYIGSTTRCLKIRLNEHINDFFHHINNPEKNKYYSSFDVIGSGGATIELIENFSCSSKNELELQERKYIKPGVNCVNIYRPGGFSWNEWYVINRPRLLIKFKKYGDENKEKIKKWRTTIVTCECGAKLNQSKLTRHKKEAQYHLEWEKDPEEFKKKQIEKAKEFWYCGDCDVSVRNKTYTKNKHKRSEKHKIATDPDYVPKVRKKKPKFIVCGCGIKHINTPCHIKRHQENHIHKEWVKLPSDEYNKKYYLCPCGASIKNRKRSKSGAFDLHGHNKTKQHLEWLLLQQ